MKDILRIAGFGALGALILPAVIALPFLPSELIEKHGNVFLSACIGGSVFAFFFVLISFSMRSIRKSESEIEEDLSMIRAQVQFLVGLAERSGDHVGMVSIDFSREGIDDGRFGNVKFEGSLNTFMTRVRKKLRKSDQVLRHGHSGMMILLAQVRSKDDFYEIVRKIRYALCESRSEEEVLSPSTGLISSALYPEDGYGVDDLINVLARGTKTGVACQVLRR